MKSAAATVHQLHLGGSKVDDDWSEAQTVDLYMDLHPDADRGAVEAELRAALADPDAPPPPFVSSRRRAAAAGSGSAGSGPPRQAGS